MSLIEHPIGRPVTVVVGAIFVTGNNNTTNLAVKRKLPRFRVAFIISAVQSLHYTLGD